MGWRFDLDTRLAVAIRRKAKQWHGFLVDT